MNVWGFLRGLLSRRDRVYLLSLLIPFVVYDLALKASDVASQSGEHGFARALDLMRSDAFFDLGYALLWIGLFAAARKGLARWAVLFFFHTATVLVVTITTCAYQYYKENGTTLDYGTLAGWVPGFDPFEPILAREVSLSSRVLLFAVLFYAILGPRIVTRR